MSLSFSEAAAAFNYDPETGAFTYKANGPGPYRRAGRPAGSVDRKGYHRLTYRGKSYAAHRVAILLTTGVWPELDIDHINGCKSDNRIANLRQVTQFENQHNLCPRRDGRARGVTPLHGGRYWVARIQAYGVIRYLGCFGTYEEAVEVRRAAEAKYHPTKPVAA